MGNYSQLIGSVRQTIKENSTGDITGTNLQSTLVSIINNLGAYATFAGIATTATSPGSPDQNVFYLASEIGTYSNFSNVTISEKGLYALRYDSNNKYWYSTRLLNLGEALSGKVTSEDIADRAVTHAKIADNAVFGAKILDNAVSEAKIANGAVTSAKISDGAVSGAKIANGAVTSAKISDGAVSEAKIADGAVAYGKIANGAVTPETIESDAVETSKIANGAVTSAKIAEKAVETSKIADGAITSKKLSTALHTELLYTKDFFAGEAIAKLSDTWAIRIGPTNDTDNRYNYYAEVNLPEISTDREIYITLLNNRPDGINKFILKIRAEIDQEIAQTVFFDGIYGVRGAANAFYLYGGDEAVVVFEYNNAYSSLMVTSVTQSPIPYASTERPGLMTSEDKAKLDALPITSVMGADHYVPLRLRGPLGMHAAGGMQDLDIDLTYVTSEHNFFKHTIYVSDREWFKGLHIVGLEAFVLKAVYWRHFEDGGSYDNTVTYPNPSQNGRYDIISPFDNWNLVQNFIKIEIEGFQVFQGALTPEPVITITITELVEV